MQSTGPTWIQAVIAVLVGLMVLAGFVMLGRKRRGSGHRMWPWVVVGLPIAYVAFIVAAAFSSGA